jgi:RHS repeat-associated protein
VAYLPYGGLRLGNASTLPTDYTFTGQRDEAGLGLMHYGARFYSPRLGRFVSADVLVPHPGDPQSWNRYSYVLNNPLIYVDPTGHQKEVALALWGFAALPIPFDELALIPAGLVCMLLDPSVQQALMYTAQHAQYYQPLPTKWAMQVSTTSTRVGAMPDRGDWTQMISNGWAISFESALGTLKDPIRC